MLVTLEKGSRARLPGPPHHGRFPPSYPPQKGRWDSRDQPGWQNNLQVKNILYICVRIYEVIAILSIFQVPNIQLILRSRRAAVF